MKKFDVTALGELLVDFTENGMSAQGNPLLEANPGGAPCNVLSMLQNLGKKTAFIGKVGADMFGTMLTQAVKDQGINIDNLVTDDTVHTTLAFVHTGVDGDRDFSFHRNPGADMMLREEEIQQEIFADTKIFHFGTLSMTDLADKMWYGISQCDILKISDDEISMREIEIMLSSIEDVKHFVQTITMFDGEFELVSGKYIVDAKYIENLQ